jgi:site-specific recombinase XerD
MNLPDRIESHELQIIKLKAQTFIESSRAENTLKAYRSDWDHFEQWCIDKGFESLPTMPEIVVLYVSDIANEYKVSSIQRRLSAISQAHKLAGYDSPVSDLKVRECMNGIKRTMGVSPSKKTAILLKDLKSMLEHIPDKTIGIRDRALLLVGFTGAFRRSELSGLNIEDISFTDDGLVITIRQSKTDQNQEGQQVGIPYGSRLHTCPVRSFKKWIEVLNQNDGPVFRSIDRHENIKDRLSSKAIGLIVKRYAELADLDSSKYGAHSLRSGFATQADLSGGKFTDIKRQGRWKNDSTVRGYMQRSNLFESNAVCDIDL